MPHKQIQQIHLVHRQTSVLIMAIPNRHASGTSVDHSHTEQQSNIEACVQARHSAHLSYIKQSRKLEVCTQARQSAHHIYT